MQPIAMSEFVNFVLTSGTSRLTSIKQLKSGHDERFSDFYRPVHEAIRDMHVTGLDTTVLDDLLSSLDPRERRIFPKVVNGYKKFLQQGKRVWFEPPARDWPLGPVQLRVAPEVGILLDGRPHAIKLYFRGDPIDPQRVVVTNQILANALSSTWPGTVFAVLDVRRARLYPYRPKSEVGLLLKAEALAFSSLWESL